VAQEAVGEGLAARFRWRVAGAHELDALQAHPGLVVGTIKAVVLDFGFGFGLRFGFWFGG